ncbi:MAG: peptidylprolyl isomerase [Muribaculaceae bacterium]|nr:peptidylprolyl isomerase [Muribaculaceae bacterium]
MVKVNKTITACIFLGVAIATIAQSNIVEQVAWWIGDQPIYKSEIEEAYQTMQYQRQQVNGDPYCVIPEQLAIEKLYLHQAELDTVEVQEYMVIQRVDSYINNMINNLGSKEKVEEMFRKPLPEIKETLMEQMTNQYKVQEVQSSLTSNIKTTPSDVRKYYDNLPADSIPFIPMQVEVQIMNVKPIIPRQEIDDVKARLRDFTERINKGESEFSTLAILYSDCGSSVHGGELGFMGRGHLEPEYAAVAFNLNDPKKVSKIVETKYGFHIIQLIEKRGDRINTRHILLQPKVSDKDLTEAINRLDTVRQEILAEKYSFEEAVRYLSQDKNTRYNKGLMINERTGTNQFEMSELPQEVSKIVNEMNVGEISKPFIMKDSESNRDIVAMIKLSRRIDAHRANLSDDYQKLKSMYENASKSRILKDWLEKKINDTYVRIEEGWRDCEFIHNGWIKNKD